jgi:hydrogenase-1 operon protein HyaF
MNSFRDIPIRIEPLSTPEDLVIAKAILHEIQAFLERLSSGGEGGTIDLRSLPAVNAASLHLLETWLPPGEVTATVTGTGTTEIRETIYAGVWWLVCKSRRGEIITEAIQVARVPDLLLSQAVDIERGAKKLGGLLAATP